jgi:hypothetical protein
MSVGVADVVIAGESITKVMSIESAMSKIDQFQGYFFVTLAQFINQPGGPDARNITVLKQPMPRKG